MFRVSSVLPNLAVLRVIRGSAAFINLSSLEILSSLEPLLGRIVFCDRPSGYVVTLLTASLASGNALTYALNLSTSRSPF